MKSEKEITRATNTGLAFTLILLIVAIFKKDLAQHLILPAAILLFITMAWPAAFKTFAPLWFGLSEFLGTIVSKIFFSLVFICVAMPVGILRKLLGKDSMKTKQWKQNTSSVFHDRNHTFSPECLEKPF